MKCLFSVRRIIHHFVVIIFLSAFSSCLLAQATCPNPGMCFLTQKAKDNWAFEHNCVFGSSTKGKDCSEKWRSSPEFLEKSEGKLELDGYIPTYNKNIKDKSGKIIHKKGDVVGVSGVTISTGVDLGQQNKTGTRKILDNYIKEFGNFGNVDVGELMKKIDPYFGKKSQDAIDALTKIPLSISAEEAKLLELAFGFDVQEKVANKFDKKNTQSMTFKTLPEEAQTAIIDFAYQYGTSDSKGPIRRKFWEYVYAGQWEDLAAWLKSNPDSYKGRRKREGDLLQQGINNGGLPTAGNPCEK